MLKTWDDLNRAMLDEGLSRSRMLHQTVPSKGDNDVLFTLYYSVLLKDFNYQSLHHYVTYNKTTFLIKCVDDVNWSL